MLVEGLIYCLQSRLKLRRPEGSINAGGCNFNSFLRRTVRFVGTTLYDYGHNTYNHQVLQEYTSSVSTPVCISAGVHEFGLYTCLYLCRCARVRSVCDGAGH